MIINLGGLQMLKNISIFDMDGTIIDSSHRQATLPDGTLNLSAWIENATPAKIAKDVVLPLAAQVQARLQRAIMS